MAGTEGTRKTTGANVLVTGGCGRIGRKLVERLIEEKNNVTVIDLHHGGFKGVRYITAPLSEVKDLGGINVVYHLAASIDYKASLAELRKRNVGPTAILLNLCKGCDRFIFMSTTSVYGESKKPIDEGTPAKPYTKYGGSKLECEDLIKKSGLPYTIIRSSQVFGSDFEEGYSTVLKKIQKGEMRIFGNGDNYIPLVHVNDLVDALMLVNGNKNAINQVYNVDGCYGKTQMEFMETAAMLLGAQPPRMKMSPFVGKLLGMLTGKRESVTEYIDKLTKNRQISIAKIRRIGFAPKVTLKSGMKEVIEAFRKEGLLE